ncbi:MAG TPA: chromate resistance protein ChrB domain-containing protein [Pseudonocardiaceae bacterium]
MRWATRRGVHIDRAACSWLIRRFVDPGAVFVFVAERAEVPADATPFDMRGVELGHRRRGGEQDCTFETILRRYDLTDPVLWKIAEAVHEADLEDDRFDAPEAPGLDAVLRGLSMILDDHAVLAVTGPMFDGLYEYYRRAVLLGRPPA